MLEDDTMQQLAEKKVVEVENVEKLEDMVVVNQDSPVHARR